MPKQIEFNGRIHEFPDDFSDEDIAAALGNETPEATPESPGMLSHIAGALPSVGGMVGSLVGGGIGGAALGGAAGAGYEQLLKHAGELPGAVADVARNVFTQPGATFRGALSGMNEGVMNATASGAVQGGLEAVGGKVISPVAKATYGLAMRPAKALRTKYGYGNLVTKGFENRVMPTQGGVQKATGAMQASKAKQAGMATDYDAKGKPALSVMQAASTGLGPLVRQAGQAQAATGAGGAAANRIGKQAANVMTGRPTMSATEMAAAKHAADEIADPAYIAARRTGGYVEAGSKPAIAKGWSKGYRETLNKAVGPEFAQQGQTTKALYGVGRMAQDAADRPNMLTNLLAGGAGVASSGGDVGEGVKNALIYRTLFSPTAQAGAAFAMQPALQYGVRGADAMTGGVGSDLLRQALLSQLLEQ